MTPFLTTLIAGAELGAAAINKRRGRNRVREKLRAELAEAMGAPEGTDWDTLIHVASTIAYINPKDST